MELELEEDVTQLSERELKDIVINRNRRGFLITAARKELEKRGIELTIDELEKQSKNITERIELAKKNNTELKYFWNSNKDYIVTDESAPLLYTKNTIRLFSVLFSVFFGGILLSMNLARIKKQRFIWLIISYSIVYVGIMVYLTSYLDIKIPAYLINLIGYLPLELSWSKLIGETLHRKRNFIVPLIIAIVLTLLTILSILV